MHIGSGYGAAFELVLGKEVSTTILVLDILPGKEVCHKVKSVNAIVDSLVSPSQCVVLDATRRKKGHGRSEKATQGDSAVEKLD
ncbi:hypothetical protein V6N11_071288 [Hibiscus sabdariffa]|uniref:Uncharacterized protein n=1 Tax=Hibiscus sabdariffa TaxID=183260 RepID=A0ABR2U005_9ROSI